MKPLKLTLRFWILLSSVFSFIFGWALFSHAGKPTPFSIFTSQNTDAAATDTTVANNTQSIPTYSTVPTLAPIPSLDSLLSNPTTTTSSGLTTGSLNVQPVQIPSANANTNIFTAPSPRLRTKRS